MWLRKPIHFKCDISGKSGRFPGLVRIVLLLVVGSGSALLPSIVVAKGWMLHKSSLSAQQSKIRALEKEIGELVHAKKAAKDSFDEIKRITTDIATKYQELRQLSDDYSKEYLHVRFQHPEKGDESERKYPRYKLKTLKEIEAAVGLDAKLDRIKTKVVDVYGATRPDSESGIDASRARHHHEPHSEMESRVPAALKKEPLNAEERIRLVK